MDDFRLAIREIEPSALREIYVEIPDVSWESVGGLEEIKNRLKESVEWPLTPTRIIRSLRNQTASRNCSIRCTRYWKDLVG